MTLVYGNDDEATLKQKQEHLKRLQELSEKSLGEIPQLEEPSYEQKAWIVRRMKGPASSWRSFR
jgi:hypothetical protein